MEANGQTARTLSELAVVDKLLYRVMDSFRASFHSRDYQILPALLYLAKMRLLEGHEEISPELMPVVLRERMVGYDEGHPSREIYDAFKDILDRMGRAPWGAFLSMLQEMEDSHFETSTPDWIERAVALVNKAGGEIGGEHIQPDSLSELLLDLVELPKGAAVYNPFAGQASIGMHLSEGSYYGEDINPKTAAIGQIRLILGDGVGGSFGVGDSILNWDNRFAPYDLLIANPPFGLRLSKRQREITDATTAELFFLKRALEDVKADGKIVAVVSGSVLFSDQPAYRMMKEQLISEDIVDMVIAFPERLLPNTSMPFNVLVIDKAKKTSGNVRFVIADRFIERVRKAEARLHSKELIEAIRSAVDTRVVRTVPNAMVIEQDLDLSPKRYFTELDEFEGSPLGSFLSVVRGQRLHTEEPARVVKIKDLKNDPFDYSMEVANLELSVPQRDMRFVGCSALLVALRGSDLKPSFFHYQGEPIYVSSNIAVFTWDTSLVETQYLILQLLSERVEGNANAMRVGAVQTFLRTKDFLSLRIRIPGLAEQAAIVLKEKESKLGHLVDELHAIQAKLGLDQHRRSSNSYLRHSIAAPLGNMRHYLEELKDHLITVSKGGQPLVWDGRIDADGEDTVAKLFGRLERRLLEVSDEVRRSGKEVSGVRDVVLTPINLYEFLLEFSRNARSHVHTLQFDFDKAALPDKDSRGEALINASPELLNKLLYNLIENADVHAFKSTNDPSHIVNMWLTREHGTEPALVLRVGNTGESFPPGFTQDKYIEKGMRAGARQGDGFGGHIVNEIVEHLRGTFELDTAPSDKRFTTIFTFHFPLTTH